MARTEKLQLQEKVRLGSKARKVSELLVFSLLLALLACRAASLLAAGGGGGAAPAGTWCRVAALICEAWFAAVWLLHMSGKWNPALFDTHPERLAGRTESGELPAVDIFVAAADPTTMDSSPVLMASAVLSLLAADYPAGKLACYVSDDACSPATCHALLEAVGFAKLWAPFCRKHGVRVRAPLPYFFSSSGTEHGGAAHHDDEFLRDWIAMKSEFEKLVDRIVEGSRVQSWDWDGEFAEFLGTESRDHPTIIRVLWDNTKCKEGEGFPSLIYISRETSPKQQHHYFKAGAMDVLTRVSGVLTNAPTILNVERNMFASNPHFALHAVCILLGFDDEVDKATHKFIGAIKDDDPFWNQTAVMYAVQITIIMLNKSSPTYKELQKKFSSSEELIESEGCIISGDMLAAQTVDLSSCIQQAKEISGQEVGWVYESMMHHILIGQRIHTAGQSSTFFNPDPPVFLGSAGALTGGPASLTQHKRWATGLLEILLSKNNPILLCIFKHIELRQCLAYLAIDVCPLRAPFELCYALLGPYCLLANRSFLPKASEPDFIVLLALLVSYSQYSFTEYMFMDCRPSASAWWNNLRMQRIVSSSAWLLAFPTVALKTLGLSETVLEVTREEQGAPGGEAAGAGATSAELGRFTFDSSPVFVPPTALTILTVVAIAVGAWRAAVGACRAAVGVPAAAGGPGAGEFLCCGWLVHCFWPFVRGLAGKGRYGIPWSVKVKAGLLVAAFVHISTRN